MERYLKWFAIGSIVIGLFLGIRYVGSVIHYNCAYAAEDCPPPIQGVGEIGWYITGGSLLPLWNHDEKTVTKVNWHIEKAHPEISTEDDLRFYEQNIAADVTTLDGTTKRYDLGTAMSCTGETMEVIENHAIVLGKVDCYFALTGTRFAALVQKSHFRIERYDESAEDGSTKTTVLVEM